MTVGRILGITYGPDHQGLEWAWGWGDFLDEEIIPAVKQARYLAAQGVAGPSLDPGGPLSVMVNQETGAEHMTKFGIGGATLVSIPAFAALRPHIFGPDEDWPDDDEDMPGEYDMDEDCGCGEPKAMVAAVNSGGWRGLPLAPREAVFDNDDAVKRITAWASGGQDVNKMRKAFNAVIVKAGDQQLVEDARAAGLSVYVEMDRKSDFARGKDIAGDVQEIVRQV